MATKRRQKARAAARGIQFLGGVTAVTKMYGLRTTWAVRKWMKEGVPPDRALDFYDRVQSEAVKQGEPPPITIHQLSPELYPLGRVTLT